MAACCVAEERGGRRDGRDARAALAVGGHHPGGRAATRAHHRVLLLPEQQPAGQGAPPCLSVVCSLVQVKGMLQWLLDSAEERKWLYGVYVGVALLPLALMCVWCCPNMGWGVKVVSIVG